MQPKYFITLRLPWPWFVRIGVAIVLFRLLGGAVHDLVAEGMSWGVAIRLGLLVQLLWNTDHRFLRME